LRGYCALPAESSGQDRVFRLAPDAGAQETDACNTEDSDPKEEHQIFYVLAALLVSNQEIKELIHDLPSLSDVLEFLLLVERAKRKQTGGQVGMPALLWFYR